MQQETPRFSAFVKYVQPDLEELIRRFPAYGIFQDCGGKHFEPIKACKEFSREDREVNFELVDIGGYTAYTDEVPERMNRKGLRPALYEELLAFAEKYPDKQWYPLVALGSETWVQGINYVAILFDGSLGRRLFLRHCGGYGHRWFGNKRYLAVRE